MANRGKSKRRKAAIQLRASRGLLKRGKAGLTNELPPEPNKKDGEQLVPNSLRRLMALKAGAPAPGKGKRVLAAKAAAQQQGVKPSVRNASSTLEQQRNSAGAAATRDDSGAAAPELPSMRQQDSGAEPAATTARKNRNKFGSAAAEAEHQSGSTAAAAAAAAPPTARQLARLERVKAKRRKQKGRGKAAAQVAAADNDSMESADSGEESEDAIAHRVLQDRNKPRFGEQAEAPLQDMMDCHCIQVCNLESFLLQTSLKRKHWDEGANARHSAMFAKHMRAGAARLPPNAAARQESMRLEVIEAYRKQKRAAHGGKVLAATRQSLAALVAGRETMPGTS